MHKITDHAVSLTYCTIIVVIVISSKITESIIRKSITDHLIENNVIAINNSDLLKADQR